MQKRSTKFYRKNEREVMQSIGFQPTKNSGSGWIEKEDGVSEHCICQLKSTDKMSITIHQKDIRVLEYNAATAHKTPIFAIQFLNTGEVWLLVKPTDTGALQDVIEGTTGKDIKDFFGIDEPEEKEYNEYNEKVQTAKEIEQSEYLKARLRYYKQKEEERRKARAKRKEELKKCRKQKK